MTAILVIEDDPSVLEYIKDSLEVVRYEVYGALNGMQGLALAKQRLPHVIVCDIMMPQMNGFQVLEAIRTDPLTRTIPLMFLTGKADRADQRWGMELGADD